MKRIWIFALLLLIIVLSGCKKASEAKDTVKDQASQLADQASQVAGSIIIQGEGNNTQIIIPPSAQQPQQRFQQTNIFSPDYKAPCILQKFAVLNLYCSGKTLFKQQSATLSWHIPYELILFVLVIFIIYFGWLLWRKRQ